MGRWAQAQPLTGRLACPRGRNTSPFFGRPHPELVGRFDRRREETTVEKRWKRPA